MQSDWARENLQVIRTLMERSAIYRRALAPVMLTAGIVGLLGGIAGELLNIHTAKGFVGYWFLVAIVASICAFLLIRRQALQDKEPFWSPPTRRVTDALMPGFFSGGILGLFAMGGEQIPTWALAASWMILYGCALHSAGFFMVRGIKWLGWIFIFAGAGLMASQTLNTRHVYPGGNIEMAATFGAVHIAYGIYLYFTERRKNAA